MNQATRSSLQNATQQARRLLEREITDQLEGTFDVLPDGTIADKLGKHLDSSQRVVRTKIVESIRHRAGGSAKSDLLADAVADYVREAAFTILNRHIALKMLEVRGLVQQCISKGDQSSGFKEFGLAATGLAQLPDKGYRLYLESLFDELSTEVKILFDRHSDASLLWPRRQAFDGLLEILNADDLGFVWKEDETIGWVYQYFNSDKDREKARYDVKGKPKAPQNSYELAVRNQFFTPRYVVEFLTDNTLGRTWYEMRRGHTSLTETCRYMVRRPTEIFLGDPELAGERLVGSPEPDESRDVPSTVKAAFRGDLGPALHEEVGKYRWWIGLAIPPDQYDKITGLPLEQLGDYPLVSDVLDAIRERPESEELADPLRIWAALSHMALTSSGGPYAVEPSDQLWRALKRAHDLDSARERSQEELLRQPVLVPYRAKKDPRDLKILDPACGSSHFLLYCFDLLLTIYAEAWADSQSPPSQVTDKSLREDYPDEASLRLALPGLILRHNLHGIDIDPRCAQIGAFALWMRAQRAYNEFKITKEFRPPITKANIVVAEPMPGEDDLLAEFLRELREDRLESLIRLALSVPPEKKIRATKAMADSLCDLVHTMWNHMKLAGEAGSLLRIDKDLEDAITKGRAEWEDKHPLFRITEYSMTGDQRTSLVRELPGEEADFWSKSEQLVIHALRTFAQGRAASVAASFRRGLFAEDAARGLAFIDVCRLRMDVVLMNPPFGAASVGSKRYIEKTYARTKNDIYAAFVERGIHWLRPRTKLGAITPRTGFFLTTFQTWREEILLKEAPLAVFADLGHGVMDAAMVEAVAYCLEVAR
jgi:hypothetical protein